MSQLALDGFDADQVDLLERLGEWPQSFPTIRFQTGWSFDRASRAVDGLLVAGKIVKGCDGAFRPFSQIWDGA